LKRFDPVLTFPRESNTSTLPLVSSVRTTLASNTRTFTPPIVWMPSPTLCLLPFGSSRYGPSLRSNTRIEPSGNFLPQPLATLIACTLSAGRGVIRYSIAGTAFEPFGCSMYQRPSFWTFFQPGPHWIAGAVWRLALALKEGKPNVAPSIEARIGWLRLALPNPEMALAMLLPVDSAAGRAGSAGVVVDGVGVVGAGVAATGVVPGWPIGSTLPGAAGCAPMPGAKPPPPTSTWPLLALDASVPLVAEGIVKPSPSGPIATDAFGASVAAGIGTEARMPASCWFVAGLVLGLIVDMAGGSMCLGRLEGRGPGGVRTNVSTSQ
jgi:hypothetical protein